MIIGKLIPAGTGFEPGRFTDQIIDVQPGKENIAVQQLDIFSSQPEESDLDYLALEDDDTESEIPEYFEDLEEELQEELEPFDDEFALDEEDDDEDADDEN